MAESSPLNSDEIEGLYPSGSTPENRINVASALCSYGTRPHAMTGFLRQLLLDHFVDPNNIEDPRIRRRLEDVGAWRPSENGENVSGIIIESHTKWQPNTSMQRQSLVIKRDRWQWQRVGIGDFADEDSRDGFMYYRGFWQGSHTVLAIAGNGAEAELLGTEVMRFLLRYGAIIVAEMGLHRFIPIGMDTLHKVKEVADHYAVPVTVAYAAEESWRTEPQAPRLKRISFRASDLF
jgi:hypothetical protein